MVEVAVKLAATDKSQESWKFLESESWSHHEQEVTGKRVACRSSKNQGILKLEAKIGHIIFMCLQLLYLTWKKVCLIVRQIYGRSPADDLNTST